jgi:hypothetical protein
MLRRMALLELVGTIGGTNYGTKTIYFAQTRVVLAEEIPNVGFSSETVGLRRSPNLVIEKGMMYMSTGPLNG